MFIKEVHIAGFRSYRELTSIDNFSPCHNVVVGRNGSGKSNFFFGIQFVLSEEFAHLKSEQRLGILHEGTGPAITNARVEIVFDNSDHRIVANDAAEVRVARHVSSKKEVYYIDGKIVTRADVVNLMESAGFSRSNPYYIVKQGKINELATAPDPHRLKLLREIAGTRVYDEKKEESIKILKDSRTKKAKIEALLQFINDRLKTLEEEKEDLKEYQKWDKMKRCLEYTLYNTESNEARTKLDKLAQQREDMNIRQNAVASQLVEVQNRSNRAAAEQRKLDNRFKGMRDEKEAVQAEQNERYQQKTALELKIKDLQEEVEKERHNRDNAENTLNLLKTDISTKEELLEKLTPKYQELIEQESALASDMRIAENKLRELFAKQGHRTQFNSVEERDAYLKKELRTLQRQIAEAEEQQKEIERSMTEDGEEEDQIAEEIRGLEMELQDNTMKLEQSSQQHVKLKKELDQGIVQHHNAGREERSIRESVTGLNQEIQGMEQVQRQLASKALMNGIDSVKKVLDYFRDHSEEQGNMEAVDGCYGTLLDFLECDPSYYQAVEVTAGSRLHHHIVLNDYIATRILKQINKMNLPGEIHFFPLNRINTASRREVTDEDARAMLDYLDYEDRFENVMRLVFGSTAIIRKLDVGPRVCRAHNVDCVTMEGDQVSRKGTWTGGYIDAKKSKLETRKTLRSLVQQRDEIQRSLSDAQAKLQNKHRDAEKIKAEIEKICNDINSFKEVHRALTERRRVLTDQLTQSTRRREPKKTQLLQERNRVREMHAQRENLQAEMGQAMQSQLSDNEKLECERLQREITEKKNLLQKVSRERGEVEGQKHKLENSLSTNLLKKRDELVNRIQDLSVDEKRHNLQAENADLQSVLSRLKQIGTRMNELEEGLQEYEEEAEKLARELEDVQEQQKDLEAQVAEFSKQADQIVTKQSTLQSKREEAYKKVRDLGTLPTEAFSKFMNLNAKQLDKKLAECMNELKKYENVNKKALEQFVQASTQKEDLQKRVEEHEENEKSIENLLEVLENRKYDAISLTFKQVAKNFKEVFNKLVPQGTGDLVMQTADSDTSSSQLSQSELSRPLIDRFTGVGIKVSFSGQDNTREMQQLSGGQKSLVALALIFAIQKCDPAPFYLFDEIDAALDAQHRKAVADMIHELSSSAQFITTTFRPELLEWAEKCYGVRFRNKVSHVDEIDKSQAYDFVEDDHTHG